MVSGDNLLSKISDKTVGGIAVVVLDDLEDGLVTVVACLRVIAESEITYLGFMVRNDACCRGDFCCFIETAINPRDHVPDLESSILDAAAHAMLRASSGEGQKLTSWLQDAQAFSPHFNGWNVAIPALAHEAQPILGIRDHSINRVVGHATQNR